MGVCVGLIGCVLSCHEIAFGVYLWFTNGIIPILHPLHCNCIVTGVQNSTTLL